MDEMSFLYDEHAYSRYCRVMLDVIHELQLAYVFHRDLGSIIPDMDRDTAEIIVAETLEADRVVNLEPEQLLDAQFVQPGRMSDFKRAALAEIFFEVQDFAREMDNESSTQNMWTLAMVNLEELARSPLASPLLWYEDIFIDLAGASIGEPEAVYWAKRALAHNLRYFEGLGAVDYLRDLVEAYLGVDELDTALSILAGILRYDPAYIWTYNLMAISFDRYGLVELGTSATQRGLALIDARGDEEELHRQLTDCLADMEKAERRGREAEVDPQVLDELRRALALDFEEGEDREPADLLRDLVPDIDEVEVKRPMRPSDFPLPSRASLKRRTQTTPTLPGRNDPCWCGSGKKYKHCHWREDRRKSRRS
jgi:tetratricopeptide (TPR) repeat protein